MNARGIPTAAYQVLHLLPEVGYPPTGVPPHPGLMGGYPSWGIPHQGIPHQGTPPPSQVQWGVPEMGYPPPSWLDLAGVPPLPQVWTDKQSETITSRLVLRTRSVNMGVEFALVRVWKSPHKEFLMIFFIWCICSGRSRISQRGCQP